MGTARHPTAHHLTAHHPTAHHLTAHHPPAFHLTALHPTALHPITMAGMEIDIMGIMVKVARRAKVARNGLTARHPTAHHLTAHHLTAHHPTALLLMLFLPLLIRRNFSYRLTKKKQS